MAERFDAAQGEVDVLEHHDADAAALAVAVRVNHQVEPAPHADQQVREVAHDHVARVDLVGDIGAVTVDGVTRLPQCAWYAAEFERGLGVASESCVCHIGHAGNVGIIQRDLGLHVHQLGVGRLGGDSEINHVDPGVFGDAARLGSSSGAVVASLVDGQRQRGGQVGANQRLDIERGLLQQRNQPR